jgi:phage terminase large subunit
METTNVFNYNYKAYRANNQLIINQGGTRSSKSFSILQLLAIIAIYDKRNLVISVVSYALPHLKLGAMRDFDNILVSLKIIPDSIKNKTDNVYKLGNSIVEFFGVDNLSKVHGPARDILFVNEINHVKEEVFNQLSVRTKGTIFVDFNPTQEFYLQTEIIPHQKHTLIKSTYLDNQFLTPEQVKRIESNKHNENWWRVYGLGELGQLEGAIFQNWKFGEFDNSLPFGFGLDFGFSNDPDALVKVAIDNKRKKIYLNEEMYQNGQGFEVLYEKLKPICKNNQIIADCAEDRLIHDLRNKGLNITKSVKGAGSILQGIKFIQDFEIIITENSYNLAKELQNYIWSDKKSETPIDDFNHLIDAFRYCVYLKINKSNKWLYI